ncbi:Transketolase [Fusarium torreyae]|uniref:Transketolase n=1 Tax=Fusarium torreyae TaxID=1237075 RepID=A0A9W8VHT4_9HYPO|nr:Transketolase [Fusarium torreyae]
MNNIDETSINTIRLLAADATFRSNSGHPGAPMGLAPAAHVLFTKFLRSSPSDPNWLNRDRFVLSNGHACILQYIVLHLLGYDVTLENLKNFRRLGSNTPGHPENFETPGVAVTTGPLGQGIANAVGLAIAQAHTASVFNRPGFDIVDNYTYCFVGDGCLQEGIASEASSLAGHLRLGNLICVYDDNRITIDGDIKCSFTEDVVKRYESYGWHVITVADGDSSLAAIEAAIQEAKNETSRPSLIKLRTTIGFGSAQEGTHGVHGNPLKSDDIAQMKQKWGFNPDESFIIPQEVYDIYRKQGLKGSKAKDEWVSLLDAYAEIYPAEHEDLQRRITGNMPEGWESSLPTFSPSDASVATRKLSESVLSKIYATFPELIGGSADLTPSNLTRWSTATDFQSPGLDNVPGDYSGRYIRYGVREHAMGAIMNGLAAYGTLIPYAGTFLNFVSYAAGAVRLSALSRLRVIWVATHDSIALGQDGPTHQPIETLAHFRALPNCLVWRPADGNETSAAYRIALNSKDKPSILALSRQNLPQLVGSSIDLAARGGYILQESTDRADITLIGTGSEVSLCVEAAKLLREKYGRRARIVSLPCWEVFDDQSEGYKLSVLAPGIPILSVEMLSTMGWHRYSHEQFGINTFGLSAPAEELFEKFEFTPPGVVKRAIATIEFWSKKGSDIDSPLTRAF